MNMASQHMMCAQLHARHSMPPHHHAHTYLFYNLLLRLISIHLIQHIHHIVDIPLDRKIILCRDADVMSDVTIGTDVERAR